MPDPVAPVTPCVVLLRSAVMADVPALVTLEQASFATDQLAARNFRQLLRCGNCVLVVAQDAKTGQPVLAGYVLLLFRARSSIARIYSIAVDQRFRGQGIGECLLVAAEKSAAERGAGQIRLEVRMENSAAIRMYEKHGYRRFGDYPGFYEDGADALRMEKSLLNT